MVVEDFLDNLPKNVARNSWCQMDRVFDHCTQEGSQEIFEDVWRGTNRSFKMLGFGSWVHGSGPQDLEI